MPRAEFLNGSRHLRAVHCHFQAILPRWRLYSFSLECFSLCRPDSFLSVQLKSLLKWESSLLGFRIEKESGKKNNFMAFLHHEKLTRWVLIACLLWARFWVGCWKYSSEQAGEVPVLMEKRPKGGEGHQRTASWSPSMACTGILLRLFPISKDLSKGLKDSHCVLHLIVHAISICCTDPGSKTEPGRANFIKRFSAYVWLCRCPEHNWRRWA